MLCQHFSFNFHVDCKVHNFHWFSYKKSIFSVDDESVVRKNDKINEKIKNTSRAEN